MTGRVDISQFDRDTDFYGELDLLLTVKSFDLQAIRKRYLTSRKNKSGRAGSVTRRDPGEGGVVSVSLTAGKLVSQEILWRTKEPRGIDFQGNRLAVSAENEVFILRPDQPVRTLRHPWFSYIHTVAWSPFDMDRLLISSSGLDIFHEFSLKTGEPTFEWLAWEHGFPTGIDPESQKQIVLTRSQAEAERLTEAGMLVKLVDSPANEHLPTAMRAAFINSVMYDPLDRDRLLATFFHEGVVYGISRASGLAKPLIKGLKNPHGGRRFGNGFLATSTAEGAIHWLEGDSLRIADFRQLPRKPTELGDMEWVQNTWAEENLWVAIDSNRTGFVIIDPTRRLYDMVPYDGNWAVQDVVVGHLPDSIERQLRSLT